MKAEWINKADFVYSNSLDHSYDPEKALNSWISCLKPGGLCILEHAYYHTAAEASEIDPFGASLHIMPFLISLWGNGRYGVRRLLSLPESSSGHQIRAIVVERFISPD